MASALCNEPSTAYNQILKM